MIEPEERIIIKKGKALGKKSAKKAIVEYIEKCSLRKRTPFLEEFALECGLSDVTIKEWAAVDDSWQKLIDKLYTMQKLDYKRKALKGKYNAKIASQLLSAEHNVVEKFKKEVTGEDGGAVKFESVLSPEQEEMARNGYLKLMEEVTKLARPPKPA